MKKAQFLECSADYLMHETYLPFLGMIDICYWRALQYDSEALSKALHTNRKMEIWIRWLEISFFIEFDPIEPDEGSEIEFYGILPVRLLLQPDSIPIHETIKTFGAPLLEPQPISWPAIHRFCESYNRDLPAPIAAPFFRLAFDETRGRSLFYRLKYFDYDTMKSQLILH